MKYLQTSIVFLLLISIVSCNGPKEIEPAKVIEPSKEKPTQTKKRVHDHDPYFVETTIVNSTNGPGSITRNILQDKKGNIWLATWEGIMQYNGKTFTNHTNKDSLRRWHVFSVLEDRYGDLWFGTIGAGVYRYKPNEKTFSNFTTKNGLAADRTGCFYEDPSGRIWIGTEEGISVYDPSASPGSDEIAFTSLRTKEVSFTNFGVKEHPNNFDINSIVEDKDGNVWIGSRGEACIYDGTTFRPFTDKEGRPFNNVRCIIKDSNDNMWFGGNDGLWRYDGIELINYNKSFVGYVYEDRNGNIWTSSESPSNRERWIVSRYDEKNLHDEKIAPTEILEERDMFFGIFEDKDNGIWMGSLNGVCRYDPLALLKPGIKSFDYFRGDETKE